MGAFWGNLGGVDGCLFPALNGLAFLSLQCSALATVIHSCHFLVPASNYSSLPTSFLLTISNLLVSPNLGRTEDFLKNMSLNLLNHQLYFIYILNSWPWTKSLPFLIKREK